MPESCVEKLDAEGQDSDSEPSGFALSVDLSPCFGAPARCRVWVRRRARKMRWLASRVRRAAKLRGPLLLLAGEHLLPPSEPLRVLRPDDTLRVARVEQEWQHAFSFEDSDEETPNPTQHSSTIGEKISCITETTKQVKRQPTPIQPSFVKPATKRKFTVGDTLFMLKQTVEERTQTHKTQEQETEHPPKSAETIEQTSEVGHVAKKSTANKCSSLDELVPEVPDYDALNRVKRRALALLEQVTEEKEDTDVVDAPKKKRRRVRRRRPAPKLYNPEESVQDQDVSGPGIVLNESQCLNTKNSHLDLTKEQNDSESDTQITPETINPNCNLDPPKEDQDLQSNNKVNGAQFPIASSVQFSKASPNPSTMLAAQPAPTWVLDFTELPAETQVPVLRNPTPSRAPRLVRAIGSEVASCDI